MVCPSAVFAAKHRCRTQHSIGSVCHRRAPVCVFVVLGAIPLQHPDRKPGQSGHLCRNSSAVATGAVVRAARGCCSCCGDVTCDAVGVRTIPAGAGLDEGVLPGTCDHIGALGCVICTSASRAMVICGGPRVRSCAACSCPRRARGPGGGLDASSGSSLICSHQAEVSRRPKRGHRRDGVGVMLAVEISARVSSVWSVRVAGGA